MVWELPCICIGCREGTTANKRSDKYEDEKPMDVNCSEEDGASHRNTKSSHDSSIPPGLGGMKFSLVRSNGSRNSWHSKTERVGKARSMDSNVYLRKKRIISEMDRTEELNQYIELGKLLGYDVTSTQKHLKELLIRNGEKTFK